MNYCTNNLIYISHRGNINGKILDLENHPDYINNTLKEFNVETDIWYLDKKFILGHDQPNFEIKESWLKENKDKLWLHCKNIKALEYFSFRSSYHYFWHEEDTITLTSLGYTWAYPGKQPIKNSIAVLPELHNDNLSLCIGICSDFIQKFKQRTLCY